MSKTREIVNSIRKQISEKTQKIQNRIKELDQELESVASSIKVLTNQLVQCEISGDSAGQDTLNKKIAELKYKQHSLEDKVQPYQTALKDTSFITDALPGLFAAAREDMETRSKAIEEDKQKRIDLVKELNKIQEDIKTLDNKTNKNQGWNLEANEIRPLLRYIETRPIKYGCEDAYLSARINGITGELMEQHFEPETDIEGQPTNLLIRTIDHGEYKPRIG